MNEIDKILTYYRKKNGLLQIQDMFKKLFSFENNNQKDQLLKMLNFASLLFWFRYLRHFLFGRRYWQMEALA